MEEIIKVFHIDAKLLIAQLINFAIVFVVLYLFAIKPIMKILRERTAKIEKGIKNAENFDEKLAELEKEKEKVILEAKKQAKDIVIEAKELAEENKKQAAQKTKDDVANIIEQAKQEVSDMKQKMVTEIKKESIDIVVAVAAKVLGEKVDKTTDKKLVEKYLDEIK